MRILDVIKRVVPFVLALALGISVASVFYAFTSVNLENTDYRYVTVSEKKIEKKKKKKKKSCRYKREYRKDY